MEKTRTLEEFMDSECSSGCQSGWTLYLGQSQESFTASRQQKTGKEEEEDLSMLSDASSGPPLLVHDDDNNNNSFCCLCYNERDGCLCNDSFLTGDKRSSFEEQKKKERSYSLLEDTASSPVFSSYKATNNTKKLLNAEIMAENHFKRKIELQKQLGYLNSFCTRESSSGLQRRR